MIFSSGTDLPEPEEHALGAAIRMQGIRVRYPAQARDAVDGVDLDVPPGRFVVLLGPSGCGKSTLLRTINRLVEPQAGTIFIDDADIRAGDAVSLRRGIGYVIQAVGLFPHLTIGENIAVVPELLQWDRERIRERVDDLLRLVRLDPQRYRDRRPRELSGGEQQRVGVARALAARPRLLLMDEPFGAVDAIVRLALQDETVAIHRALGTTIVFVTHDVDEALRVADRIVVMNEGRVVQYDTALRILTHPATPFVAQLLDAGDVIRRLGLLRAGEAMRPAAGEPSQAVIAPGQSLREALNLLLDGSDRIDVVDGGRPVGILAFDDIRRALSQSA
jgi:osmoprotectant transport system ATP-binding protein